MSNKKYKLLKDLPDVKAGTILTYDGHDSYDYTTSDNIASFYYDRQVENNPEWFEEQLPEKIKVNIDIGSNDKFIIAYFSEEISKEKYPSIKQAIEAVINNDENVESRVRKQEFNIYEAQLIKAEEMAFIAAREAIIKDKELQYRYSTPQDYINQLK